MRPSGCGHCDFATSFLDIVCMGRLIWRAPPQKPRATAPCHRVEKARYYQLVADFRGAGELRAGNLDRRKGSRGADSRTLGQFYRALVSAARERVSKILVHVRTATLDALVFSGAAGFGVGVFLEVRALFPS